MNSYLHMCAVSAAGEDSDWTGTLNFALNLLALLVVVLLALFSPSSIGFVVGTVTVLLAFFSGSTSHFVVNSRSVDWFASILYSIPLRFIVIFTYRSEEDDLDLVAKGS